MFNMRLNNMSTLFKRCCISVCMLFLVACQSPEEQVSVEQTAKETEMTKEIVQPQETSEVYTATVKYIELEGGFYGLLTKDGKKLLPKNLAKDYLTDGTIISFRMVPMDDVMTTQQWGTLVMVSDVALVKKGVDKKDL